MQRSNAIPLRWKTSQQGEIFLFNLRSLILYVLTEDKIHGGPYEVYMEDEGINESGRLRVFPPCWPSVDRKHSYRRGLPMSRK